MNTYSKAKQLPDSAEAYAWCDALGPGENFAFQTFDDSNLKRSFLSRVFYGSFEQHFHELRALNHQGAGVFGMVNRGDGLVHPGRRTCRTNANATSVRALFVDLDGSPIEPVLASIPGPHIVVESSACKFHAYWRCNGVPLADFKRLQRALAKRFDGDPSVNDLARVMRIPGFYHQKGTPFMTRLVAPR